MDKSEPIYIAGHRGLVGSAIQRKLTAEGFKRLLTRTRAELDRLVVVRLDSSDPRRGQHHERRFLCREKSFD